MSKKIDIKKIVTLGDLKKSGYKSKSIKDEVRDNLIASIQNKENAFEGILSFDQVVQSLDYLCLKNTLNSV